jgi:hypothetical protein
VISTLEDSIYLNF